MTHRPTFVSVYSSQGLSQQLSNLQIRRAFKRNTFINGGNLQPAEFNTKDSCKIALAIGYRVYRPVLATLPCTLASTTGYRVYRLVLATQPCTLVSTTGYRVCRPGTSYTAFTERFILAGYRTFLPITNQHQESQLQGLPAGHSSSAAYSPA